METSNNQAETLGFAKRKDIWIVILLLAIGGIAWYTMNSMQKRITGFQAEITYDGKTVAIVSLDEEQEIVLEQNPEVVIAIRDGKIGFIHSDCPDQVCVQTGFFSESGGFAACLPNRVMVRVLQKDGSQRPDWVAG